jgi:hypothetical protein
MFPYLICHVMNVDHRAFDSCLIKAVEHMIDERLAGNFHQRLRR